MDKIHPFGHRVLLLLRAENPARKDIVTATTDVPDWPDDVLVNG
ncbi:MAG: hypothetical protein ACT6RN_15965 [Agrobacterium sp.]